MAEKKKTKGELIPREYTGPPGMMREFDRMFDEFRSGFENIFLMPSGFGFERPSGWMMPSLEMAREPLVDLADMGDKFELTAEMPGIPKDKIDIQLSDDSIEIKAEVEEEKEEKEKEYCCKERSYRSFYRKMSLPDDVISEKADAKMAGGVLKITLPKKEPKKMPETKKIEVK